LFIPVYLTAKTESPEHSISYCSRSNQCINGRWQVFFWRHGNLSCKCL